MENNHEHAEVDTELEELKERCSQLQSKMKRAQDLQKHRDDEKSKVIATALERAIRASQEASLASERASRAREEALDVMTACLCPDVSATSNGRKRKAVDDDTETRESKSASQGTNVEGAATHLIELLGGLEERIVGRVIEHIDKRSQRLEHAKEPEVDNDKRPSSAKQPSGPAAKRPRSAKLPEPATRPDSAKQPEPASLVPLGPAIHPGPPRQLPSAGAYCHRSMRGIDPYNRHIGFAQMPRGFLPAKT